MAERKNASLLPPQTVGVREFRSNFSGFMRQVRQGASFVVTSRDEVVAVIQPPPPPSPRRQPGTLRGKIEIAPDFDAITPGFLAMMESDGA